MTSLLQTSPNIPCTAEIGLEHSKPDTPFSIMIFFFIKLLLNQKTQQQNRKHNHKSENNCKTENTTH